MKFVGFIKNGRGVFNEVDEPMGATGSIAIVKELENSVQIIEIDLGEAKARKPYKKREKTEMETKVPD